MVPFSFRKPVLDVTIALVLRRIGSFLMSFKLDVSVHLCFVNPIQYLFNLMMNNFAYEPIIVASYEAKLNTETSRSKLLSFCMLINFKYSSF